MRSGFVVLFLWLLTLPTHAQTPLPQPTLDTTNLGVIGAAFTTTNQTPLIGQPFRLTLTIRASEDLTIDDETLPTLQSALDMGFEVLSQSPVEVSTRDGQQVITQQFRAVLWQTASFTTPELLIPYMQQGVLRTAPVRSVTLQPQTIVPAPQNAAIRPLLAEFDLDFFPRWIIQVAVAIAAFWMIVVSIALRSTQRRRRNLRTRTAEAAEAIFALRNLKARNELPAVAFPIISNLVRTFVEQHSGVEASELTTTELLYVLQQKAYLTDHLRQRLRMLLDQADLVKFAQFTPDADSVQVLINVATSWVREADRQQVAHSQEETA